MSTLNISLPAALKAFVATQVRSGLYSSASDYVRTLIRADQHRGAEATCDAQLLAGLGRDDGAGVPPEVRAWLEPRLRHGLHVGHAARG